YAALAGGPASAPPSPALACLLLALLVADLRLPWVRVVSVVLLFLLLFSDRRAVYKKNQAFLYNFRTNEEVSLSRDRVVRPVVATNGRTVYPRKEFAFDIRDWVYRKVPLTDWYHPLGEPVYFYFKRAPFMSNIASFAGTPELVERPRRASFSSDNAWVDARVLPVLALSNGRLMAYRDQRGWLEGVPASNAALSRITAFALGPNRLDLRVDVPPGGVNLLFTQQHHPGWRAEIDGRPAPLFDANALFIGMGIPSGEHRVSVAFRPGWGALAILAAYWSLLLLSLGAIAFAWAASARRGRLGRP
ncbi:MAG: hypothetical protein J0L75_21445, partial [Spirochaetes bacterium]|nr:hypothetical protein [Spirochaetota bacterium]